MVIMMSLQECVENLALLSPPHPRLSLRLPQEITGKETCVSVGCVVGVVLGVALWCSLTCVQDGEGVWEAG